MQARTETNRARKPLDHDGSNQQSDKPGRRGKRRKPITSQKTTETLDRIAELAEQCRDLAIRVRERQRAERIESIMEWCGDVAIRLADDRFGNGEEPDYMADVVSVAWEISELSNGK